jgi:hypothetical protein
LGSAETGLASVDASIAMATLVRILEIIDVLLERLLDAMAARFSAQCIYMHCAENPCINSEEFERTRACKPSSDFC